MKKITTLIALIFCFITLLSQTTLESELFNMINKYRYEISIRQLKWDNKVYEVSKDQSLYMSKTDNCTHDQQAETGDFSNFDMKLFKDKYDRKGIDTDIYTIGENCYIGYDVFNSTNHQIAKRVFNAWVNSPPHNEMLLDNDFFFGSVRALIKNGNVYSSFNCIN